MKRFILILFAMCLSLVASAQYAPAGELSVRGAKILCNGEKLTVDQAVAIFSDIDGTDRSADYLSYRKGYRTGVGLMVGGASAVVLGSATCFGSFIAALVVGLPLSIAGEETPIGIDIGLYSGLTVASAGVAAMIAGIPTLCVYRKRLGNLTDAYNSRTAGSSVDLAFGPAPSGLGFTLNF